MGAETLIVREDPCPSPTPTPQALIPILKVGQPQQQFRQATFRLVGAQEVKEAVSLDHSLAITDFQARGINYREK